MAGRAFRVKSKAKPPASSGEPCEINVQLALLGHVQELHHQPIQRQISIAIHLRDVKELFLRRIDGLALYVAVNRPRQHVGDAGQLAVALVDFVRFVTSDHEEGDPVANFEDQTFCWLKPRSTVVFDGLSR